MGAQTTEAATALTMTAPKNESPIPLYRRQAARSNSLRWELFQDYVLIQADPEWQEVMRLIREADADRDHPRMRHLLREIQRVAQRVLNEAEGLRHG